MSTITRTRLSVNSDTLNQTEQIQVKTIEALSRIQHQTAETEQIGKATNEELHHQGVQLVKTQNQINEVGVKLDESKQLQGRFDLIAGNWSGNKKHEALREAGMEIRQRNEVEHTKIREVYELQKYDAFSRSWKPAGLVLCTDPNVYCLDLFNPTEQATAERPAWSVDFSLTHIDANGWTYASDFAKFKKHDGEKIAQWNSFARRRKWRRTEQTGKIANSPVVNKVAKRHEERKQRASDEGKKKATAAMQPFQAQGKIQLTVTGYAAQRDGFNSELDEECLLKWKATQENNVVIANHLGQIDRSLDNLTSLAKDMNTQVKTHNGRIGKMEGKMQPILEKMTVVNARQRYINR